MYMSVRAMLMGSELIDTEEYIASSVEVMTAGIRSCAPCCAEEVFSKTIWFLLS
jgi:hypothetical protein